MRPSTGTVVCSATRARPSDRPALTPGQGASTMTTNRVQLALNVTDLDAAVAFYSALFGVEPHKRRPGYANFAIADPPLKLVLFEHPPPTRRSTISGSNSSPPTRSPPLLADSRMPAWPCAPPTASCAATPCRTRCTSQRPMCRSGSGSSTPSSTTPPATTPSTARRCAATPRAKTWRAAHDRRRDDNEPTNSRANGTGSCGSRTCPRRR